MKFILFFITLPFYGQVLHHQMLSSQGTSKKIANGYIISQTIGQQSTVGNSDKNVVAIQGFQQSNWSTIISSNETNQITTLTFPNPFAEVVNFQFSQAIKEEMSISVFDIAGRLVYQQKKQVTNQLLSINLSNLPQSEYLVKLQNNTLTYYTKLVKL